MDNVKKFTEALLNAKTIEELHNIDDIILKAYVIDKTITDIERKCLLKVYEEKILSF